MQKPKILRLNTKIKCCFSNSMSIFKLDSGYMLMESKLSQCQTANCGPTRMHSGYIYISGFILISSGQM